MRLCVCERFKAETPYDESQCRRCWKYHHDADYRSARDAIAGKDRPAPIPAPKLIDAMLTLDEEISAWTVAGRPLVSQEVHDKRRIECEGCPYFAAGRCLACGCSGEKAPMLARAFSWLKHGTDVPGMWWMATKSCPRDPPVWEATVKP